MLGRFAVRTEFRDAVGVLGGFETARLSEVVSDFWNLAFRAFLIEIAVILRDSESHLVPPVILIFEVGMNQIMKQANFSELPCTSRIRESVYGVPAINICPIFDAS